MSALIRKYPAICLLLLAVILGITPLLMVSAGLLPPWASQLGALSSSLAGIVLVVVEGRKGGLRELLGRFLIWRVGLRSKVGLIPAILGYSLFVIAGSIQFTWVFNNTRGSVLPAAVMYGASNTWAGYIDVYRGQSGNVLAFVVVSVVLSIVIALLTGAADLSRTNKRNMLELEGEQPAGVSHSGLMSGQPLSR